MKVGIITMQRVCNYGSFLQAYGLKKMIESLGHEVIFVDYKIEWPICNSAREKMKCVISKVKKTGFRAMENMPFFLKFMPDVFQYAAYGHNKYKKEYWELLGLSKKREYCTKVDTLVIGSDEVFNCLQSNVDVGYSRELFGYNSKADKIITYAASFGNTTLEGLKNAGIASQIKEYFYKMSSISVRDRNSKKIVEQLTNRTDIEENLDPVLMYDFHDIEQKNVDINDYIIVYAYRQRFEKKEIECIKRFAENNKKKIVCIGGYQSFGDIKVQTSPLRIFDYFRKADYVITDTFHGTIFSVINHAKFGVFIREGHGKIYGNSEKLTDLLRRLNLDSRVIKDLSKMESVLKTDIDYALVDRIVVDERKKTLDYLKTNL